MQRSEPHKRAQLVVMGEHRSTITLGNNATGSYTITATNNGKSVTGIATVQTSPPDPQILDSCDKWTWLRRARCPTLTFVVEVREDGTATSGETVDFSITAGDGNATLGSTSETTGSNGRDRHRPRLYLGTMPPART